jgi:hypothetical protein
VCTSLCFDTSARSTSGDASRLPSSTKISS